MSYQRLKILLTNGGVMSLNICGLGVGGYKLVDDCQVLFISESLGEASKAGLH